MKRFSKYGKRPQTNKTRMVFKRRARTSWKKPCQKGEANVLLSFFDRPRWTCGLLAPQEERGIQWVQNRYSDTYGTANAFPKLLRTDSDDLFFSKLLFDPTENNAQKRSSNIWEKKGRHTRTHNVLNLPVLTLRTALRCRRRAWVVTNRPSFLSTYWCPSECWHWGRRQTNTCFFFFSKKLHFV